MWSSCIASLIPYAKTKGAHTYEAPGVTYCAPVATLIDTFPSKSTCICGEFGFQSVLESERQIGDRNINLIEQEQNGQILILS